MELKDGEVQRIDELDKRFSRMSRDITIGGVTMAAYLEKGVRVNEFDPRPEDLHLMVPVNGRKMKFEGLIYPREYWSYVGVEEEHPP